MIKSNCCDIEYGIRQKNDTHQKIESDLENIGRSWLYRLPFYSNLLMGQYTVTAPGQDNGLLWAIRNIFTKENFIIALVTALIGHLVFEFFRKRV